jgi:molybdenum cofactor cytidylyltransferase
MFSCILLSAGFSQRFGSPKALARFDGETIVTILQKTLLKSLVDEIVIVIGAHQEAIKPFILNHKRVKLVYNKDYKFGQTSSFQSGLKAVSPESRGIFLLPVDFPFVQSLTFDRLIKIFLKEQCQILIPTYQGHKGHPPLFSNKLKAEILALPTEAGVNTLIHKYSQFTANWEIHDEGVILSFNTGEEFQVICRKWQKRMLKKESETG